MSGVNVDFYKAQLLKQLELLDARLLNNEYVKMINEKTAVRPSFLIIGVSVLVLLLLVWGVGAQFVSNLIGFGYPLYESYRTLAINQVSTGAQSHLDSQWLTYWILYGFFHLIESLTDFFLYWIPLYHAVKVAFLVWCFLPQTRGAEIVYHKVIEPVLLRYEAKIDAVGRDTKRATNRVIADVAQEVADSQRSEAKGEIQPGER